MSAISKFISHYTVSDYQSWKGDWELWEGFAVAMIPSPFGRHQRLAFKLGMLFENAIAKRECHATVIPEVDWIVTDDTVVRPDLIVVCGDGPERHLEKTPDLVVEVLSASTRQHDLNYKRELYHRLGVGAYWMVDEEAQTIVIDVRQSDGTYLPDHVESEVKVRLCEDCELVIIVNELFSR